APVAELAPAADVDDQDARGRRGRDRDVDGEVVARRAADRDGAAREQRARPHRLEPRVHRTGAALAEGGGAEGEQVGARAGGHRKSKATLTAPVSSWRAR